MSQPITQGDWELLALLALFLVYGLSVCGLAKLWEPIWTNPTDDEYWDNE